VSNFSANVAISGTSYVTDSVPWIWRHVVATANSAAGVSGPVANPKSVANWRPRLKASPHERSAVVNVSPSADVQVSGPPLVVSVAASSSDPPHPHSSAIASAKPVAYLALVKKPHRTRRGV
jgi:hypothetical protein